MTTQLKTRDIPYKDPSSCRCSDNANPTNDSLPGPLPDPVSGLKSAHHAYRLPRGAFLGFNHCNLPSCLLGSALYQDHPVPLELDGVHALHRRLFEALDQLDDSPSRARLFAAHMEAHFSLLRPHEAGAGNSTARIRPRANYLKLLRGWGFSSEGREGAVLKGWVESRFGLMTRYHKEALTDPESAAYTRFVAERSAGLYGAHALESQLDLVYSYVQYELARRYPGVTHFSLYRGANGGANGVGGYELMQPTDDKHVVLMNNLSSFSMQHERADEFGDRVLHVRIPVHKVFCLYGLLPGLPHGEDEVMVIGGVYLADFVTP
jgi:NAD+--dinitrogen-reductase ADP-D-ribosyltransferase